MRAWRAALVGLSVASALALPAAWAGAEDAPDFTLPAPPPVVVAVPGAPRADAHLLPDLPEAPVTITAGDRIRSAIVALLPQVDRLAARLPRRDREALAAYYAVNPAIFVGDRAWTAAGNGVIARLQTADEDGLDPNEYRTPAFARAAPTEADWAEAEIKLAVAAAAYARDARGARIDLAKISSLVTPKLSLPAADAVLAGLAAAPKAGDALAAYNPPHPGYRALRARLAELRASRPAAPSVRVPLGRALRVGMRDPRVPLIRVRFKLGPAAADENAYDERVASAVAAFQREKGLPANGVLTPQTVAALSGPSPARLEGDLIANMERWRWLPPELGERHVLVNVPEFRLRLFERNAVLHQAKVIVGRTETPTPIFSDEMETVIVNPSWTVPPSILRNEFLPALAHDPYYAERKGFRVFRRGNQISIQQPPGERNALGHIKFIFPNQHSVYLHDTPTRNLFGAERRAFSHGCVRVDQPFRLADELLAQESPWSEKKLRGLVGKGERHIRLRRTVPVHITYFTTSIDADGQLHTFDDLYGFNGKIKQALGLPG